MKRSLKSVVRLFIIMVIMIPVFVFADAGISPNIKVKILNENGWLVAEGDRYGSNIEEYNEINKKYIITKEEYLNKLKEVDLDEYNKKIKEWENFGYPTNYYYFPYNETVEISFEKREGSINVNTLGFAGTSDLDLYKEMQPIVNPFDLNDEQVNRHSENQTLLTINEEGTQIYSGPSYMYDKLVIIPFGTKIESMYYVNDWEYVTYNNTSGWIYNGDIGYKRNNKAILTKTTTIYNIDNKEDKKIINRDTIVDEVYTDSYNINYLYYLKDNYYVKTSDFACEYKNELTNESETMITSNEVTLYDTENKNKSTIIPKDTKFICEYGFSAPSNDGCYIEYNGVKGWITSYFLKYSEKSNNEKYIIEEINFITEKAKINDKIKLNISTIETYNDIKFEVARVSLSNEEDNESYVFEIKYDEQDGYYILLTGYDYIKPSKYKVNNAYIYASDIEYDSSNINSNTIEIYEEKQEEIIENNNEAETKLTTYQIIIICVILILVLSMFVYVIMLFVNKTKNNKNS